VLAALRERDRTGQGQEIQSALFENCVLLASQHMQQYLMTGEVPPPFPSRVSAWSVYDTFTVANGEQLFIGAVSDKQFVALCEVIDRPDLLADPTLATNAQRVAVRPELLKKLADTLQHLDQETLCTQLQAAGLPYAKVVRPDQLIEDEHLLASGGLVPMGTEDGGTTQSVLLPLLMGGRRLNVRQPIAAVGEHTDEVLASLASRSFHQKGDIHEISNFVPPGCGVGAGLQRHSGQSECCRRTTFEGDHSRQRGFGARHHHSRGGPVPFQGIGWPLGGGGKPAGCGWRDRCCGALPCCTRRQHHRHDFEQPRGQPQCVRQDAV
jgi:hypothetical protein